MWRLHRRKTQRPYEHVRAASLNEAVPASSTSALPSVRSDSEVDPVLKGSLDTKLLSSSAPIVSGAGPLQHGHRFDTYSDSGMLSSSCNIVCIRGTGVACQVVTFLGVGEAGISSLMAIVCLNAQG